jgi:hypothetical protein
MINTRDEAEAGEVASCWLLFRLYTNDTAPDSYHRKVKSHESSASYGEFVAL